MKNLRLTLLAAVAIASASVTLAGPGPQYWQQHRASNVAQKPGAASAEKSPAVSDAVSGKQGAQPNGTKAETAKCKAMCCS